MEWEDIQGLVISGYASMHQARYLFLRVTDAASARGWITGLADRITVSSGPEPRRCLNVAFTADGLRALGLDPSDLLTFPVPFQEGMIESHRQRLLGDTGPNAPEHWDWGGTAATSPTRHGQIHALLLLYAPDQATMDAEAAHEIELLDAAGLEVVHAITPEPLPGEVNVGGFGIEHFGFADGMSQPVIAGSGADADLSAGQRQRSVINAGEFVLGYPDGYRQLTPWPQLSGSDPQRADFGRNGTFLVARQLAQDVAAFWQFMAANAEPEAMDRLAAKLVGRWPSGAPLVLSYQRDDPDLGAENDFAYAEVDPYGERCPLGAHIRRANPRDAKSSPPAEAIELANLHRLIRRGRVYGPGLADRLVDDHVERGLLFLALNANLERQFEFVQHTWLGNPKFDGLYDETDAVLGNPADGPGRFTIQGSPFRTEVRGLKNFVTVRGGAYFFMPGVRGLRMLGQGPAS